MSEKIEEATQPEDDFLDSPVRPGIRFKFSSIPVVSGMRVAVPPLIADGKNASK